MFSRLADLYLAALAVPVIRGSPAIGRSRRKTAIGAA
jgi:hypothetical protein